MVMRSVSAAVSTEAKRLGDRLRYRSVLATSHKGLVANTKRSNIEFGVLEAEIHTQRTERRATIL